jgi:hypothetical protein
MNLRRRCVPVLVAAALLVQSIPLVFVDPDPETSGRTERGAARLRALDVCGRRSGVGSAAADLPLLPAPAAMFVAPDLPAAAAVEFAVDLPEGFPPSVLRPPRS